MANVKISALPAVTVPALTDVLPIVQGGVTKQATLSQYTAMGPIFTQVTNFSSADILANFVGIDVINAPGVGLISIPIAGIFEYYFNSIAYTDAVNAGMSFQYNGTAVTIGGGDFRSVIRNTVANGARFAGPYNATTGAVTLTSACVNVSIRISSATAYAAGNGTAKLTMYYTKQAVSI